MGSDQQETWGQWASSADRRDRPDRPTRDDRIDKVVTDYSNLPRDQTRVPLAHRIQLKFDRFSGFINEYFSNISPGGIFIRTDTPELPGQLLDFEFRLGDGYELIRGRGEVVWARERGEGPERPPGMGVRFLELSPGSKDLIYKIVDDYVAHGGKPFDPTPPPPAAGPEAGAPEPAGEERAPMPEARPAGAAAAQPALPETPEPLRPPASVSGAPLPPSAAGAPPPGLPRPAAPPPAADPPSLPWRLEIPAIQQLPGVPAITPRSPLESLGAGGGAAATAGEPAPGVLSEIGAAGAPAGHAIDPLAQVAAALPPLDELAPDVPALPPAAPPPAAPVAPLAAPSPPAFSSFDMRAQHRRSRLPLIGAVLAVALIGLAVYLLRDTALAWLERRETGQPEQASAPPVAPPASAAPASPTGPRSPAERRAARAAAGAAVPPAVGAAVPPAAAGPNAGQEPANGGGPGAAGVPRVTAPDSGSTAAGKPAGAPAAAASGSPGGVATPPLRPAAAASPVAAAPATTAPTVTAPPVTPAAGGTAASPAPSAAPPAGRTVLEPVATSGTGHGAGAPAANAARVTAVLRITFQPLADGTEVVLWGNGEFTSGSYTRERIGGLPVREVIKITGIDRPFPSPRLAVRTPELAQIRIGYHPPQELHVVLDLGGRDVQVAGIAPGPRQLRIRLHAQ
jgi:molecular chaperone DnaK